ncbi:MAG TPA: hypothetical protein VFE37_20140 [Chloroflexota bacterium]|nr:hypothetical protein [Chloroflexota bacterium]
MTGVLPIEVYDARRFWVVMDTEGTMWVVRHGAVWAQRKPYHGGVRGVQRADETAERLVIERLVHEEAAAAA